MLIKVCIELDFTPVIAWRSSIKFIVAAPVDVLSKLFKEVKQQGPNTLKCGLVIVSVTPAFRFDYDLVLPIAYIPMKGVSEDDVPGAVVRHEEDCSYIILVHGRAGSKIVASMHPEKEWEVRESIEFVERGNEKEMEDLAKLGFYELAKAEGVDEDPDFEEELHAVMGRHLLVKVMITFTYYNDRTKVPNNVQSVIIDSLVTEIGNSAFMDCTSLASIVIPNSVKTIDNKAFQGCTSLATIEIPDSVTTIGDSAFYGCTSLLSIVIPNSVKTIGAYAFMDCTSLASIEIPDSVTTIGDSTFNGCTSLESIVIPNSVTTIGESVVDGSSKKAARM
jgi:hypothetical protein